MKRYPWWWFFMLYLSCMAFTLDAALTFALFHFEYDVAAWIYLGVVVVTHCRMSIKAVNWLEDWREGVSHLADHDSAVLPGAK